MRIAIVDIDRERRYKILRLTEDVLLHRGILPEVVMLPRLWELADKSARQSNSFDVAIISGFHDASDLRELCRYIPVILIGNKDDGVSAYEIGAKYFIENPIEETNIDKALTRCLPKI